MWKEIQLRCIGKQALLCAIHKHNFCLCEFFKARHQNICLKTKKREANRKPFDMAKQRAMGTELEAFNAAKKYNATPSERARRLAYERVS